MWAPSEALAALQREYRKGSVVESFRLAEKILSTETPSASDVERSAALKIRGWAKTFLDDFRGAIKDLEEAAALSPHLKKQTGGTKVLLSALKRAVNTKLRIQRAARDHWSVIAPDEARKCSEESSAWNRADFRMEWYRRTVLRRSSERKAELRNPPDTPDVLDNKEPWGGAEFRGCISRSLRCPIPHFPYGQATNGVLFEKLDSLDLKWDKDARALDPVPHAEFPFPVCPPCANSVKVETPREGLDLFVSPKAVDECSLDLLRKWFDLRAEETQDFPVPQYHNLLDPNLSVHLAALPGGGLPFKPGELSGGRQRGRMENWQGDPRAWRWTPTDVLVEAHPVETEQIVYLLQLKALRSKSCGNKMFGEAVVRRVLDFWRDWEAKEQKEFVLTARLCGPLAGCGEGLRMFGEEETVDASGHRVERKGDFDALFHSLVERILRSAAPLLAQLRRPALLLPGPLQVVCKAQRIFVKEGEEYEGVWHLDGEAERVVAVGILYLRMSPSLEVGLSIDHERDVIVSRGGK
uniref:Uncharacterized protein n=1 Tax=Chromera velia CCMP2878 TaxID=1169474 RepID=A0A0G4F339_9ALVE|eukprot:Cvel_14857.t1-p1 / transcript=Cvel_14857.t1 / gene=Cvel_14857 / organism=Chromera_velia_CCMP2878 / gene_product=hypothetical protein / transcript_product=hypothetical protein / location=Cvel_scaffold1074:1339-4118(+) / protein_length=523 / sequence_SO=supercontig / SO=protein_coding / is_pseudo=false